MDKFDEFYDSLELQCLSQQEVAELSYEAGRQSRQAEVDEKDKRISKTLDMLEGDLSYVEEDYRCDFEFLKMAMIRCLKDDIKALRGDDAP